jgi:hypothetical protein
VHGGQQTRMYTVLPNAGTKALHQTARTASRQSAERPEMAADSNARIEQQTGTEHRVIRSLRNGDSPSYQQTRTELGLSPPPGQFEGVHHGRHTRSQRTSA